MKLWSIITLMVFLNFTALPGIAAILGWSLPQTNVVVNEEETQSHVTFVVYEKVIPKALDIHDFLKFSEPDNRKQTIVKRKANAYFSPLLTIFSPPPENV